MFPITKANLPVFLHEFLEEAVYRYYSIVTRFRKPYEIIFVLSHMRSGSSLLTHLMISNPEICGYGETHIRYSNTYDLKKLIGKALFKRRRFVRVGSERYILDKVLHNRLLRPEDIKVLFSINARVIILIREPEGTLLSLIRTQGISEVAAMEYYTNRLEMIEHYVRCLPKEVQCIALTYDELINETKKVFRVLEQSLELNEPIVEEYKILPTTGKRGVGDPSANIKSGTIVRQRKPQQGVKISAKNLEGAQEAFDHCYRVVRQRSITIDR